jgi:hypothetical protein
MKNKLFLIGLVIVFALPATLTAADVSGEWTAEAPSQSGNVTIKLTFKVEGEKLTGTLNNPDMEAVELKEGKVTEKKVYFYVPREMNGASYKIIWDGEITGEKEITFNRSVEMSGGGFGGGGQGGGQGAAENKIIAKKVEK